MNCENYKILINDLVEGELDSHTAGEVNLHIFDCRNCETEFEMLSNESEMYSHFLFEIEPPKDLSERFKARLEAENRQEITSATIPSWFANVFGLLTFKPIFAAAIVLILVGIGYFSLERSIRNNDKITASQPANPDVSPSEVITDKEFVSNQPDSIVPEITKAILLPSKRVEKQIEQLPIVKTRSSVETSKIFTTSLTKIKKPSIEVRKVKLPKTNGEDEAKFNEIRSFEIATAKQIEKVEMLLRGFRNIRNVEGGEEYDVEYESGQARRLLEKNVQLRLQAENYGTFATNEILSKVEPYLLDIANLDVNPSEEEVLEIKQRVKNQNIIVSLQGF